MSGVMSLQASRSYTNLTVALAASFPVSSTEPAVFKGVTYVTEEAGSRVWRFGESITSYDNTTIGGYRVYADYAQTVLVATRIADGMRASFDNGATWTAAAKPAALYAARGSTSAPTLRLQSIINLGGTFHLFFQYGWVDSGNTRSGHRHISTTDFVNFSGVTELGTLGFSESSGYAYRFYLLGSRIVAVAFSGNMAEPIRTATNPTGTWTNTGYTGTSNAQTQHAGGLTIFRSLGSNTPEGVITTADGVTFTQYAENTGKYSLHGVCVLDGWHFLLARDQVSFQWGIWKDQSPSGDFSRLCFTSDPGAVPGLGASSAFLVATPLGVMVVNGFSPSRMQTLN